MKLITPPRLALVGLVMMAAGSAAPGRGDALDGSSLASFRAVTQGDAVQLRLVDQGAPLFPGGEVLAGSPASAGAGIDSTGQSSAFASAPYPGSAWIALPGNYNGVRPPGAPEAPPYPWYAGSSYPGNPKAETSQGGSTLKATSSADSSAGDARSGAVSTGEARLLAATATSAVTVDRASGTLLAISDTAVDGFSLGSDVSFGHLASHAKLAGAPGQKPTRETSFDVASFRVGGQTVGFTDKGFVVAGAAQKLDSTPVNTLTSPAGVTITYVPKIETPTSIESAGFSVTLQRNVPNQGNVRISLTFGRVMAQLESVLATSDSTIGSVDAPTGPAAPVTTAADTSTGAPEPAAAVAPAPLADGAAGTAASSPLSAGNSATGAVPTTGDAAPGGAPPVAAPASPGADDHVLALARRNAAELARLSQTDAGHQFYDGLAIAGFAIVMGALLFGRRAVKPTP